MFRNKFLISLIVLSTIPVAIMAVFSSYISNNIISGQINQMHLIFLNQVEKDMNSQFKKFDELMLQYTFNNSSLIQYTEQKLDYTNYRAVNDLTDILTTLRNGMEDVVEVDFYSKGFDRIVTSGGPIFNKDDFADPVAVDKTNRLVQYGAWIDTRAHVNARLSKPVITYIRPLDHSDSKPGNGFFIVYLDAESLSNKLSRNDGFDDPSSYYVLNASGEVMLDANPARLGTRIDSPAFLSELGQSKGTSYYHFHTKINGKTSLVSTIYSDSREWYYISEIPLQTITKETDRLRNLLLGICLGFILVSIGISFKTSSVITYPLQRLMQHIQQSRPIPKSRDEAHHILGYIQNLEEHNVSLTEKLEQFRTDAGNYSILSHLLGNARDKELQIEHFDQKKIAVLLIELDQVHIQSQYSVKDQYLFYYALENIAAEILQPHGPVKTLMIQPGQFVVLSQPRNEMLHLYRSYADTLLNSIRTYLKLNCVISVGYADSGTSDLHEAYAQAKQALRYSFTLGVNRVIISDELDPSVSDEAKIVTEMEANLFGSLQLFKYEDAGRYFRRLAHTLKEDFPMTSDALLSYYSQLLGAMIHAVKKQNPGLTQQLSMKELTTELAGQRNAAEIEHFIELRFFGLLSEQPRQLVTGERQQVEKVLDHIHRHYDQDISLQHCAELIGLSTSQLSRQFKKFVGSNFVEYVIQYRIRIAKELLADPAHSVQDISDKLRYTSVNSFIRVFKQVTGLTPGSYRKELPPGRADDSGPAD